jgi:uncharacterized protein
MKDKKKALKDIIRDLHAGLPVEVARDRFRREVGSVSTPELVEIEQSLIDDGLPPEEVARFCNVHVLLVQDGLEEPGGAGPSARAIEMMQKENTVIRDIAGRLRQIVASGPRAGEVVAELAKLAGLERHYASKENVIFPNLERRGFPGPSKVMWQKDNEIRALLKTAVAETAALGGSDTVPERTVKKHILPLLDEVTGMADKEEQILLPAAAERLTAEDWARASIEMDELGYAFLAAGQAATAPRGAAAPPAESPGAGQAAEGMVLLPSGRLAVEELMRVLNTLPLDLTFVDADDRVRYFTEGKDRIFVRTRSVIGRTVQNCHPPRSLDAVQRILDSFRAGKSDHADFWIRMGGKTIYIRYFAVRGEAGKYLGTLEVTQDITEIRGLEGEKRLLD